MGDKWRPIETAPAHVDVLVTGDSGYIAPYDRFYINAHLDPPYRGDRWLDATGTCLEDTGWEPTHWMPLPNPPEVQHG